MGTRWIHKKRGTVYEIVTDNAAIQCSTEPFIEQRYGEEKWTVYRNVETEMMYVRLTNEFLDGRFEKIDTDYNQVPVQR